MEVPFSSYYDYDEDGNLDLRDKREQDGLDDDAEHMSTTAGAIQNMTICLCCSGNDHGAFKKKTLYVQDQVRVAEPRLIMSS